MSRKPKITKVDASSIAIRYATAHGLSVSGATDVSCPHNDGTWSVFVPHGLTIGPQGVIVIVDQFSGEASFFPTL